MSTDGFQPVPVDQYGGLCTLIDRSDLPVGLSPDCQNVEFFPSGVRSRSGFVIHQATGTNPIADMLTYTTVAGDRKLLVLGVDGAIVGGAVESAPADIPFGGFSATTTALGRDPRMRGTTAFGRAYFSLYGNWSPTGATTAAQYMPICGPFQYDGTSITPVTQAGPPASFTVANTGGGTIGMSGGRHYFVVVYETSTGYVTSPSGPVGDTFTAGDYAALASVPVGPGAIVKRIVFATPADSVSFFTLPRFAINDNTTTTINVDFTDAELLSGTSLEDYIDSPRIPPVMGVEKYGRRLVYWGGNDRLQPFFDADATVTTQPVVVGLTALDFDEQALALPAPWVATGAGGAVTTQAGAALQVYRLTGNGVAATRGQIDQVAANVALSGTYYIRPQRTYGLRARVRGNGLAAVGNLVITLRGSATNVAGSGTTLATLTLPLAPFTNTDWTIISASGTSVAASYAFVNMTVVLSGTPTNGVVADVDYIEVYDATTPSSRSTLWVTDLDSPETVNLTTGTVAVAEDDGQDILNVFELRGNLYVCKEHSLYVVTDDGNEPADWSVDQVSNIIGAVSPHGVALGDGWAHIIDRDGLYYFTGGVPEKISQEIQPTWDACNWGWGIKSWIALDPGDKRVYVGIIETTTRTNVVSFYVLDYVEGLGDPVAGGGTGRKWTKWRFAAATQGNVNAGIMAERANLTASFFTSYQFKIMVQSATATEDEDAGSATAYYETAPIGQEIGRSLFDRIVMRIRGAGTLSTSTRTPGGTLTAQASKTLVAAPDDDIEIKMHAIQTQLGVLWTTVGTGDSWNIRKLAVFLKPAAFSYLRKT